MCFDFAADTDSSAERQLADGVYWATVGLLVSLALIFVFVACVSPAF